MQCRRHTFIIRPLLCSDATHYTMIKSFRHKGVMAYFMTGSQAGIQSKHAERLHIQLTALNAATQPMDMNVSGWKLHKLAGKNPKGQTIEGHWAVTVNSNWRLTFCFVGQDATLVDYQDYH